MTVLVHKHYCNPVDKAILWTFWMQFFYHFGIKLKFLLTNLVYIHLIYVQRTKNTILDFGFWYLLQALCNAELTSIEKEVWQADQMAAQLMWQEAYVKYVCEVFEFCQYKE